MYKVIILLTRREGTTHDEFLHWWLNDHRALAEQLPGVRKLVFNDVADGSGPDGIAELWFDSEQAAIDAYATEAGKRVAAHTLSYVQSRIRLVVTEHQIVG